MTDVQSNGEHKNLYFGQPSECQIKTNDIPASSSLSTGQWKPLKSCGADRIRIPPRRHVPPMDKNSDEHLSNQKKQRYWNSWEELYIVELWRRYKDEVTVINVPLPVYRKMMIAMRNRNMVVTAQDCRRKINTLNTRYKQELKRMETTGCKSEWRLFPLLHCVMQPKIKEFDPWHETKIIKKLLDKIPKPVEIKNPTHVINNISYQTSQTHNLPTPSNAHYQQLSLNTDQTSPVSKAVYTDSSSAFYKIPLSSYGHLDNSSILPFRNITLEKIEQLRQDNNRLAAQRDEDLQRLQIEENNFKCFETFIRIWTEQKQLELQQVELISEESVISLENEENHNVEQQLQETVIAK